MLNEGIKKGTYEPSNDITMHDLETFQSFGIGRNLQKFQKSP